MQRHGIRGRAAIKRGHEPLRRLQGRRRVPRAVDILPALGDRHPHQLGLPRPDRDGHDGPDVRIGARARHREEARAAEPAEESGDRRRGCARCPVPRERRG